MKISFLSAQPGRASSETRASAQLAKRLGPRLPGYFSKRLRRPFFIVGCGRSGTTLLASILANHPSIAVFPTEGNDIWHPDLYPWHRTKTLLPPIWMDPRAFTEHSLERLDWRKVRSVFGAFQGLLRKPVFVNKSVMLSFMLGEIARELPDARFIHLYRDGRAVALSYAKKNLEKVRQHASEYARVGIQPDFESLVRISFAHWMDHIDAVEAADVENRLTAGGRLLEMSYERLSDSPRESLAKVTAFMGLEGESPDLLEGTVIQNRNFKFSEKLPAVLLSELEESGAGILRRKGYTYS